MEQREQRERGGRKGNSGTQREEAVSSGLTDSLTGTQAGFAMVRVIIQKDLIITICLTC